VRRRAGRSARRAESRSRRSGGGGPSWCVACDTSRHVAVPDLGSAALARSLSRASFGPVRALRRSSGTPRRGRGGARQGGILGPLPCRRRAPRSEWTRPRTAIDAARYSASRRRLPSARTAFVLSEAAMTGTRRRHASSRALRGRPTGYRRTLRSASRRNRVHGSKGTLVPVPFSRPSSSSPAAAFPQVKNRRQRSLRSFGPAITGRLHGAGVASTLADYGR